jgi:hypothetical protein
MTKKWTIELYYLVGTSIVALGLFSLRPKFPSDNFAEQLIGRSLTTTLTVFVFGQIWVTLYFVTNAVRQVWLRFRNRLTNVILFATSILVILILILWQKLISDQGTAFTEDGLVVYPPLTGFTETEYNVQTKLLATRLLWTGEIIASLIAATALIWTIKRSNGTRA